MWPRKVIRRINGVEVFRIISEDTDCLIAPRKSFVSTLTSKYVETAP